MDSSDRSGLESDLPILGVASVSTGIVVVVSSRSLPAMTLLRIRRKPSDFVILRLMHFGRSLRERVETP
jgi:hypothetical protein